MSEDREEGLNMIQEMHKSLEETRVGPTSLDVTDEQISIGPTSLDVTDEQISIGEVPLAEIQDQKVQEQNKEVEQRQEEARINKRKQKRRITSYLSNISKQVEKQGHQIGKLTMTIQSLQKQTRSTTSTAVVKGQFQSIKQIKSQLRLLQKQVARIQNDIQRIRSAPIARTKSKSRKLSSSATTTATVKPRSKKSRSIKSIKIKRRRKNR
ncbi:MAG: hypothetical protein ACRD8Z_27860 [Nitrososphaeraceae archaeon]